MKVAVLVNLENIRINYHVVEIVNIAMHKKFPLIDEYKSIIFNASIL